MDTAKQSFVLRTVSSHTWQVTTNKVNVVVQLAPEANISESLSVEIDVLVTDIVTVVEDLIAATDAENKEN